MLGLICIGLPAAADEDLFRKMKIESIKGEQVPKFYFPGMGGERIELKKLRRKVIFLNVWAAWCGPCREEMPSMEILHQQFKGKEFTLLTVSVDYEEKKAVRGFIKKHRYTFSVLLDLKCMALELYNGKGIPATFIIDKKGSLVGKAIGQGLDEPGGGLVF